MNHGVRVNFDSYLEKERRLKKKNKKKGLMKINQEKEEHGMHGQMVSYLYLVTALGFNSEVDSEFSGQRLDKGESYCDDDTLFEGFNWIRRQGRPACIFSNLKEIKIFRFKGSKDEVMLIKYLLQNAEVLEKMTTECPDYL
ncbi:hypothetical protein LguiB_031662 [Lonicera macranthoides]